MALYFYSLQFFFNLGFILKIDLSIAWLTTLITVKWFEVSEKKQRRVCVCVHYRHELYVYVMKDRQRLQLSNRDKEFQIG